eukprot:457931-Amphidinium_carterae.1
MQSRARLGAIRIPDSYNQSLQDWLKINHKNCMGAARDVLQSKMSLHECAKPGMCKLRKSCFGTFRQVAVSFALEVTQCTWQQQQKRCIGAGPYIKV